MQIVQVYVVCTHFKRSNQRAVESPIVHGFPRFVTAMKQAKIHTRTSGPAAIYGQVSCQCGAVFGHGELLLCWSAKARFLYLRCQPRALPGVTYAARLGRMERGRTLSLLTESIQILEAILPLVAFLT